VIPVATTNKSSPVDRVRDWFLDNYSKHLHGIEDFNQGKEDMYLYLREPLDIDEFDEVLRDNGFKTEILNGSSGKSLNVLEVEYLEEGGVQQYKTGSTYYEREEVSLGGVPEPIWENGEFAGKTVEETFEHIVMYLEQRYIS